MEQPADDATRAAAERSEPRLVRDLTAAFRSLQGEMSERQIAEALRNGNVASVLYRLPLDKLSDDMRVVVETLANLSTEQAALVASEVADELHIRTWFDRLMPEFAGSMQAYRDSLVTGLSDDVRRTVERVVIQGTQDGQNPIEVARQVKALVPLTERQAIAVMNYRRALETGASEALDRVLRDRRSDGRVRRAIETGTKIDPDQIDRLVAAYEKRQLQYRARMISRTEALRAANWGTRASYLQMVQRGDFPLEAVNRKWLVARDERTCPICLSIPRLNAKGVGLLEPFQSIEGPVELPPQHPHCRCTVLYKIDSTMLMRLAA